MVAERMMGRSAVQEAERELNGRRDAVQLCEDPGPSHFVQLPFMYLNLHIHEPFSFVKVQLPFSFVNSRS